MRIVRDEDALISALTSENKRTQRFKSKPDRRVQATELFKAENRFQSDGPCGRCGQSVHNQVKWPAINSRCSNCKKTGHWFAVCRKRLRDLKFLDVETGPDHVDLPQEPVKESDILRIYALQPSNNMPTHDKWAQTVTLLGRPTWFRIDTGARCNTPTLNDYQSVQHLAGDLQSWQ